jgi:hypothetical protein
VCGLTDISQYEFIGCWRNIYPFLVGYDPIDVVLLGKAAKFFYRRDDAWSFSGRIQTDTHWINSVSLLQAEFEVTPHNTQVIVRLF